MKKLLLFTFCFSILKISSQNKPILYNFAELPQTLLLNPAAEVSYKYHVGVPLLSGISIEAGFTNFSIYDFFGANSISFNDKISSLLNTLESRDYLKIHSQIEILNAGFRLRKDMYVSFGYYQEIDGILFFPKDALSIYLEGNAVNRMYNASSINYQLDVMGVLHAGVSKKMNEKLTLGGRAKLYLSSFNLQSKTNTGTLVTLEDTENLYRHILQDIDISFQSSGIFAQDSADIFPKGILLSNNLGIGFDFGITYHLAPQLEFSASILDLGFVSNSNNVSSYTTKGEYVFNGLEAAVGPGQATQTWEELGDEFEENLPSGDNINSYVSWRPTKLNSSLKYSFGRFKSKVCYDKINKDLYTNALGLQLYSVFRHLGPQFALTGFYERMLTEKLQTKFTYTIDNYSFTNIGIGVSTKIGKVNFYGMVGNLIQFSDIASTNNFSAQLGINFISN